MNIYIIGNANELTDISNRLTPNDIIIRFNNINTTCKISANILFVANGYNLKHISFNSHYVNNNFSLLFRYPIIRNSQYLNLSPLRKFTYLFYCIPKFFLFILFHTHKLPKIIFFKKSYYQYCQKLLNYHLPSTGFLAIIYCLKTYPNSHIYIHNFTHIGKGEHPWLKEKLYIQKLIQMGLIKQL